MCRPQFKKGHIQRPKEERKKEERHRPKNNKSTTFRVLLHLFTPLARPPDDIQPFKNHPIHKPSSRRHRRGRPTTNGPHSAFNANPCGASYYSSVIANRSLLGGTPSTLLENLGQLPRLEERGDDVAPACVRWRLRVVDKGQSS